MADGSHYIAQYENAIHYQDENGMWQEIDNTLVSSAANGNDDVNGYETSNLKRSIKFANNSNSSKLLTIKDDNYKINFGLIGANGVKGITVTNPQEVDSSTTKLEQFTIVKKNVSSVIYEDILTDVDLQYIVIGNDVKENIIVKSKSESYSYTFSLKLNKLYAEMQEDGTVGLFDEKTNELQYVIPLPFMYDAGDSYSDAVEFALVQTKNKEYELTITADSSWINSENRAFPVTIDPAIEKSGTSSITDTMIHEVYPDSNYNDSTGPMVGYPGTFEGFRLITLVKLNSLPTIPEKAIITNATISMNCLGFQNTSSMRVGTYQVNNSWDSNATWNLFYSSTAISDDLLDYQNLTSTQTYDWNITKLAKKWYDGTANNYGVAFDSVTYDFYTGTNPVRVMFSSSEYTSGATPVFTIVYRDSKGVEDYYTYQTYSAGNAGTAYISDYTSELTLIKNDLSYSNASVGLDVYHTYNTVYAGKYFTYNSSEGISSINTLPFNAMRFGDGWKLNIQETVKYIGIEDSHYLVYNDADGTDHYFPYQGSGVYHDEDGLGLTLTSRYYMDLGITSYYMTDGYGNSKEFMSGLLTEMIDVNGNTIRIYYTSSTNSIPTNHPTGDGTEVISHITVKTADQDIEETVMTFSFNSSTKCLSSITNAIDNTTTSFNYTYNSTNGTYLLTGVINTDGTTTTYTYTDGLMTRAYDTTSSYGYNFEYLTGTSKVSFVEEYANSIIGKQYKFENEFGFHCVVTYGGKDGFISAYGDANTVLDNTVTDYVFDYSGRTISSATRTYSDMVLLSSSNVEYLDPGDNLSTQNNLVGRTFSSSQKASSHIKNGSFETGTSGWTSLTSSTSKAHSGIYSAKLTGSSSGEVCISQTPEMTFRYSLDGTAYYVFSAYINTSEMTAVTDDGGVYIKLVRPNGTEIKSDVIRVKTSNDAQNGWIQLSVLFDSSYYDATAYLCATGVTGNVYFDDVQIGFSHSPSVYSYLQNGGMELGWISETSSTYDSWTYMSNGNLNIQHNHSADAIQGWRYFTIEGNPLYTSRVSQTAYLNETGYSAYALSGWAKATSVFGADSMFAMKAVVTYSNNLSEEFVFDFNPESTEWQYNEGLIEPFSTITDEDQRDTYVNMLVAGTLSISTIQVSFVYDYNSGTACIDEFNLVKTSSTSYAYNEDGDVTKEIAGTDVTTYTYDPDSNNYTVQINNESEYTVTRDEFYNITGISQDGIAMNITNEDGKFTAITTTGTDGSYLYSSSLYSSDGKFVTAEQDTNGNTINYFYNANEQLEAMQTVKPGSMTTSNTVLHEYTYNDNGFLSMEYISGIVSLAYTYDGDKISSILRGGYIKDVDEKQNMSYNYTYNPFGNLETISIGSNTPLVTYEYPEGDKTPYAGNCNPSIIHLANDNLIGYTYDKLDRVVLIQYGEEAYPHIDKASIRYDHWGNICRVEDMEIDKVYLYDYGVDGVLSYAVVIHADGEQQIMYSAEDNNGRTTSTSTAIDLAQSVTTTYTYGDTDTTISDKLTASSLAYQNGSITFNNAFSYVYDSLDRLTSSTLSGNGKTLTSTYTYKTLTGSRTSNLVESLEWTSPSIDTVTFEYEYDLLGNITAIYENAVLVASYQYDDQGQVIYECLPVQNVEYEYTYDTYGNIRSVIKRNATTGLILDTQTYTYGDSIWLDKLTAFNGVSFTYDASGNPLTYNNGSSYTFTWDTARNLTSVVKGGVTTSYEYNADGLRTEKQYGTTTYKYYYDGNKLLRQTWGSESMDFLYDANGEIYSMIYGDTQYFYVKNLQGDVVQIRSKWGTVLVEYEYDAWGNCTVAYAHSSYGDLATLNPIRYRSYFYDFETGFYYLQSRYYDPQVRRFISADDPGMLGVSGTFLSYNYYSYCENNPINNSDQSGYFVFSFKLKMALLAGFGWGLYNAGADCYGLVLDSPGAWLQLGLSFAKGFIRGFFTVYAITSFKSGYGIQMIKGIVMGLVNVVLSLILGDIQSPKDALKAFSEGYADNFVPSVLPEKFARFKDIFLFFMDAFELKVS